MNVEQAKLDLILQAVSAGKVQTMVARGTSMGTSVPDGSLVFLSPVKHIALGDIVAVLINAETFVIHRVVGLRRNAYLTKGDANRGPDPWVTLDQVKAIVHTIEPASI